MEKTVIANTTNDLKTGVDGAVDNGLERIVIRHRRTKRAHRAVAGIRSLNPTKLALLAASIAKGDFIVAYKILVDSGITLKRVRAIEAVGWKRSYQLGTHYKEVGYKESDTHSERECILGSIN